MDSDEHILLSLAIVSGLALLLWKLNLKALLIYSAPMFITCLLPDIIEKPTNFSHRRLFHSRRAFKFLSISLGIALLLAIFKSSDYFFLFFSIVGYLGHLAADSLTFRGLPR
jgi:membrane-bound metal-dependent hydrolase YbcI (DUF457 family)